MGPTFQSCTRLDESDIRRKNMARVGEQAADIIGGMSAMMFEQLEDFQGYCLALILYLKHR